jgi:hypothetical protein
LARKVVPLSPKVSALESTKNNQHWLVTSMLQKQNVSHMTTIRLVVNIRIKNIVWAHFGKVVNGMKIPKNVSTTSAALTSLNRNASW